MFAIAVAVLLICGGCGAVAETSERTIVFIHDDTNYGQNVFMRGGISSTERACVSGDAANDPCAISIQTNVVPTDTSSSYYQWSQGDQYLDWYGAEPGQGEYQNTPAGGTPLIWTTDVNDGGDTPDTDGYGYSAYNRFGDQYWMLDVQMNCSQTEAGWFEFKLYTLPSNTWEPDISQYSLCAGDPTYTPYTSNNHLARCGMMNLFYATYDECNIWSIPKSPDKVPEDGCGVPKMFENPGHRTLEQSPQVRIVNGEPAAIGKWPWQGVLEYSGTLGGCGAVLIDSSWAVTAAHCVSGTSANSLNVVFGEQNLQVDQGNEVVKEVKQITIHSDYQNPNNTVVDDYDVALIELESPVNLTDNYIINSACLPYGYSTDAFDDAVCWATGFGNTQGTGESFRLNELYVPVWSEAACVLTLGTSQASVRQVCIGTSTESACSGDDGGPLVCLANKKWVLVGTMAWTTATCQGGPSVYTRMTQFVDWIDSVRGYSTPWAA